MRRVLVSLVIAGLALCGPIAAQVQVASAKGPSPAEKKPATKPADKPASPEAKAQPVEVKDKAKEPEKSEVLAELQQLRQLLLEQNREIEAQRAQLREQQERMETLERRLAESPSSAAAPVAESKAEPAPPQSGDVMKKLDDRLTQVETDFGAYKKSNDGKVNRVGPFSLSGDARIRFEPFIGGGSPTSPNRDRNRFRYRLRFNATAKFNDQFSGGFSLGSGDTNDPISTNQTMTGGFTRKPFFIDKAFVKYDPVWAKPLSLTAGKFSYTWYRTELTFDNDLNPEGISETLAWSFKNSPVERIAFVGFQLPVIEVSSGPDMFLFGGQFQSVWKLGTAMKFGGYVGYYNYQRADTLRAARASGSIGGSSNSNSASLNGQQFNSKFGLLDIIGRLDWNTPAPRWPVMLQFDYVNNTRACDNVVNIPLAQRTPCDSSDNHGFWAEVQFGRTREQGDWNFGYTFIRLEREAVLDAFNFSDLRLPTNEFNHRLNINYQMYRNITWGFTGLFGRQLVTATSGTKEEILKRFQFDLIYKF